MKLKSHSIILLFLFLVSMRCGKKEAINITNDNKREVLLQYGKQNPENEVIIQTDLGIIRLKLYDETPLHRANFIKLIKDGYYNQPEFYRIVQNFVVQGGVPMKKLDYTIPAEFNSKYFHKRGALAMARTDDNNPGKESSSTEFYIVHGNKYADWEYEEEEKDLGLATTAEQRKLYTTIGGEMRLDTQYTVFGEVIDGLDVIDKIASIKIYSSERPYKKIPFEIKLTDK